ncbi:MAG: amino acid permease, partial [Proteobacteria bacterium]|nr:amino acid permease [Pseudomonadota bacterium]
MVEHQRDAGLVRAVGPWGLAASTIGIVIGAGIFAVPAKLAAGAGVYAPLALLACAVIIGAIGICYAEGGS